MPTTVDDYLGKVTIADGPWDTELDKLGCPPGCCREEYNVTKPEWVQQVADSYVAAGAEILLTNTFGANRYALDRHDRRDKVVDFNRAGSQISQRAASGRARVFGVIGPSGKMLLMDEVAQDELVESFTQQALALAEGGADALIVESMTEMAEAALAVKAAKKTGLLVVGSMTFDSGPNRTDTAMGVTPQQAVEGLIHAGADIVGCNCGISVDDCVRVVKMMRVATNKPLWVKANAGMPEIGGGNIVYEMTPTEYADKAKMLVKAGANIIGGCCGTSPEFIRALRATRLR